jgi:hypothetical protein
MMVRSRRGGPVEPQKQKRLLIGLGGVVAVVAIVVGAMALTGDDDSSDGASSTTSSSTSSSTTTSTVATTSTTIPAADLDAAVYPDLAAGAVGFDDPVELAKAFSLEILGFDDSALIGGFQAGDARSGEVEVRPRPGTDPTVVLVRQLTDGSWAVIGAITGTIRLDTPAQGSTLRSPQPLVGAALAFEGHVNVTLYADGQEVAIATTFVLGGGDEMRPFSGQVTFTAPKGTTRGVLVLSAAGGEDGGTLAATAIRVRF